MARISVSTAIRIAVAVVVMVVLVVVAVGIVQERRANLVNLSVTDLQSPRGLTALDDGELLISEVLGNPCRGRKYASSVMIPAKMPATRDWEEAERPRLR